MAYAAVADIRGLDGMGNPPFSDAQIQEGIDFATKRVDDYCGTSFEYKAFTVTLDGAYSAWIMTDPQVLYIRTITAVTIDGVSVSSPGTKFTGRSDGYVIRTDGEYFPGTPYGQGQNVVITGTAGITTAAPADIKWAIRTIARQYVLDLKNRTPDRALSIANEWGNIPLAQSGGPGRPTSMPDVNTVLNANKHKPGMTGAVIS
jgi:hypothetical protein